MSLSLYPNVVNQNTFFQEEPPPYAAFGDKWINKLNGNIYFYLKDDNGKLYWVEVGSNLSGS